MKKLLSITIIVLSSLSMNAYYKNTKDNSKKTSAVKKIFNNKTGFNLGISNNAISMPPNFINGTPHLGVEIGFTNALNKKNKKNYLTIGSDAGIFRQGSLQTGMFLKPRIGYNINVYKGITVQPVLGAGLLVSNRGNAEFVKNSDNTYKKTSSLGTHFMGSAGLQINAPSIGARKLKYTPYVKYEFAAQTPFAAISNLLPINRLNLGVIVNNTDKLDKK